MCAEIRSVNLKGLKIEMSDGLVLELFDHLYWHLLPVNPISISSNGPANLNSAGIMAHNIKIGKGLAIAMETLLDGITPAYTRKGPRADAELALEEVRIKRFSERPSRLKSYFLFHSKKTAIAKQNEWHMADRYLTPCYVVLNSARFHHGDIKIFEELTNQSGAKNLAEQYWEGFNPSSPEEFGRMEVIADSCLYFPNWQNIPSVDIV